MPQLSVSIKAEISNKSLNKFGGYLVEDISVMVND